MRPEALPDRNVDWKAAALFTLGLSACASCGGSETAEPDFNDTDCVVTRIADGDTLDCQDGRRIRLLLIDAPEMAQAPYGARARDALAALTPLGTNLRTEYDVERIDPFNRDLTYLYAPDGTMINEAIVAQGYAVVLVIPPNGRYEDRIRAAMEAAQAAGAGLWADWGFACLPRDFRAGICTSPPAGIAR